MSLLNQLSNAHEVYASQTAAAGDAAVIYPLPSIEEMNVEDSVHRADKHDLFKLKIHQRGLKHDVAQAYKGFHEHSNGLATPPSDEPATLIDPIQQSVFLPASTRLRNMINKADRLIVCPGVYDGFSARIAMSLPFSALYMVSDSSTPNCAEC